MKIFFTLLLCLLLATTGCKKKEETPPSAAPAPLPAGALFANPIEPLTVELPNEALPLWGSFREAKPALVLLSFDPMLQPLPEALKKDALALARRGSREEIRARGSFYRSSPLLLPTQTLSAALEGGFFSRVYWVFPSTVTPEQLSLDFFRTQMTEAGFFSEAEAADLTLGDGVFSGQMRGVPFTAVHPYVLPDDPGPFVLHIDLSYFRGLYKDETRTPLYDLLHSTATTLGETGWKPLAVSLSYSTEEGMLSLDTRFLITDLAELVRRPVLLEGEMPRAWELRSEALYGTSVFQGEKLLDLYRQAAEAAPQSASARFDLHRTRLENKEPGIALKLLDETVALDPGYGYAYIDLAQVAIKDGNIPVALELIEKGAVLYPENPFLDIQQADLLQHMGREKEALALLAELKKKSWSEVYHPQVQETLKEVGERARKKSRGEE